MAEVSVGLILLLVRRLDDRVSVGRYLQYCPETITVPAWSEAICAAGENFTYTYVESRHVVTAFSLGIWQADKTLRGFLCKSRSLSTCSCFGICC